MRKLPSFSNGFMKTDYVLQPTPKQEIVSFEPKEDELKKLIEKYSEYSSKLLALEGRQDKFDEALSELKNNVLACLTKHVEEPPKVKEEETLVCEMEKAKTAVRNKRTFLKMNEDLVLKLHEKFNMFPKEFDDKLYTTNCIDAYVEFKGRKMEVDGACVLKLLNSLGGRSSMV